MVHKHIIVEARRNNITTSVLGQKYRIFTPIGDTGIIGDIYFNLKSNA
jgi:hypothetical protein